MFFQQNPITIFRCSTQNAQTIAVARPFFLCKRINNDWLIVSSNVNWRQHQTCCRFCCSSCSVAECQTSFAFRGSIRISQICFFNNPINRTRYFFLFPCSRNTIFKTFFNNDTILWLGVLS